MKKAAIFSFALVLGLLLVSAPMNALASNCSSKSATTSASVDKVKAVNAKAVSSCSADKANREVESATSAATEKAGEIKAQYATASFNVKGMTCIGCEGHLTKVLQNHAAITNVDKVCHASGTAMVQYDPSKVDCPSKFTALINDAGYQAEMIPAVATSADASTAKMVSGKACDPTMCSASKTCDPSACAVMNKTISTDDGSR